MIMTKEQTRLALEKIVRTCYFGATRRSRLEWNLRDLDMDLPTASSFIRICLDARLLEDFHSWGWVGVTPFLLSVLDNWDALTQDMPWTDEVTGTGDDDDETASV